MLATVLLVFVAVYCCGRIVDITRQYRREAALHVALMAYKPVVVNASNPSNPSDAQISPSPHTPPGTSADMQAATQSTALTSVQDDMASDTQTDGLPDSHASTSVQVGALSDASTSVQSDALLDALALVQSGALPDESTLAQVGVLPDESTLAQVGALADASTSVQVGALPDASTSVQGGALPDASTSMQSGALPDVLALVQSGTLPDASTSMQVGTLFDASTSVQVGALSDASTSVQVGTLSDVPSEFSWLDAIRARNADVVGWIAIPGTAVDYPFVQGKDNQVYLDRDFDGNTAAAGTIFLDARNDAGFGDFSTLLYGHNMKNGSMFGELDRFGDEAFFAEHREATLWLADGLYSLDIIAFMFVTANNAMMYDTLRLEPALHTQYLAYVAKNARRFRDLGVVAGDRFVTFSTCTSGRSDTRSILIARMRCDSEALYVASNPPLGE